MAALDLVELRGDQRDRSGVEQLLLRVEHRAGRRAARGRLPGRGRRPAAGHRGRVRDHRQARPHQRGLRRRARGHAGRRRRAHRHRHGAGRVARGGRGRGRHLVAAPRGARAERARHRVQHRGRALDDARRGRPRGADHLRERRRGRDQPRLLQDVAARSRRIVAPAQANMIFGALVQDGMADEMSITVLATGIAASALERAVSGSVDVRPLLPQAGRPGRRRAGLPAFLRRK